MSHACMLAESVVLTAPIVFPPSYPNVPSGTDGGYRNLRHQPGGPLPDLAGLRKHKSPQKTPKISLPCVGLMQGDGTRPNCKPGRQRRHPRNRRNPPCRMPDMATLRADPAGRPSTSKAWQGWEPTPRQSVPAFNKGVPSRQCRFRTGG